MITIKTDGCVWSMLTTDLLPTFLASYDETSFELLPKGETVSHSIFVDQKNGKILRNKSKDIEYLKVK
jgi:hypothetical protein